MPSSRFGACLALCFAFVGCGGQIFDQPGPEGGGGSTGQGGNTGGAGGAGGAEGGGGQTPEIPLLGGDCDPMVPTHCGLPFPSNVYLLDDPDGQNPSGKSVRFGATTLPTRASDGAHVTPGMFYDRDGFSVASSPMTHMPGATVTGCATPYDIASSLADDSPTVLIEAETGRRVPHWVDLDMSTDHDDERLLMIRPAERLVDGTRYVVAIRNVVDAGGAALEPSPVFAALRDGEPLADGSEQEIFTVDARQDLYADIFAKLDDAGVARDDLQIAWDFTTATKENTTGPMIAMRDLALEAVGDEGPEFEVVNVEEFPTVADNPYLLRRVEVRMTVPLYLTNGATSFEGDDELAFLNVDEDGNIVQNGTMEMDVLIHVPRSVQGGIGNHGLLQNGHGLFGSRNEGRNGFLAKTANQDEYVAFSMNLFGFDEDAEAFAGQILTGRFEGIESFTERQIQGMVNQLLGMRMMIGRVAVDGIRDQNDAVLVDPAWIDPSIRAYRGDSQGGIMGATYMSISTDVTRGLLGEPGMAYSLLLNRSVDWEQYEVLLKLGYGDNGIDKQIFLAILQLLWDRAEPSGFASFLENDPLPNTPSHRVILHLGRGDHQVTTFGAHLLARAIGAKQLASSDPQQAVFEELFGIETVDAPLDEGSVLVEYDFGLPPNPAVNLPQGTGCDPHDRVHTLEPSFDQQDHFFRTGTIEWSCNGACNCDDTGALPRTEIGCAESFTDQCE